MTKKQIFPDEPMPITVTQAYLVDKVVVFKDHRRGSVHMLIRFDAGDDCGFINVDGLMVNNVEYKVTGPGRYSIKRALADNQKVYQYDTLLEALQDLNTQENK